jgi:uncharacterized Zn finger protein
MREVSEKAADITKEMKQQLDETSYKIMSASHSGVVYDIFLGDDDTSEGPKCTCWSFQRRRLPCKHFATVFYHFGKTWDSLPTKHRNNPVFVLGEDCIGVIEDNTIMDGALMNAVEDNIIVDGSLMNGADCNRAHTEQSYPIEQCQTGDSKKALNNCCDEVRELLSKIRSVTYLTNSLNDMQVAKATLSGLYKKLRATSHTVEGLMLE